MTNLSRTGLFAFVLASVACGGTAETDAPLEPLASESSAIANDPACPKRPPVLGSGCLPERLQCFYHTRECPPGNLTRYICLSNGSNLAWTDNTPKCDVSH